MKNKFFIFLALLLICSLIFVIFINNKDSETGLKIKATVHSFENINVHQKTVSECPQTMLGTTSFGDVKIGWDVQGNSVADTLSCQVIGQKVDLESNVILEEKKLGEEVSDILIPSMSDASAYFETNISIPDCYNTLILSCNNSQIYKVFYSGK